MKKTICFTLILILSSCSVGPDHKKPDVTELTPDAWRWEIETSLAELPKGEWWKIFNDSVLNELERDSLEKNQDLQAAIARVDQARAVVKMSRSRFFPNLSVNPFARRERTSGNLPTPIPVDVPIGHINSFSTPINVSYEVDLWGRVRRLNESANAQEQASKADTENVRLILASEVAINYFLFRAQENELTVLRRIVEIKNEALEILKQQFKVGTISETKVLQAKTEQAEAQAQLAKAGQRQAETINALALLCSTIPNKLSIAKPTVTHEPNPVPPGLPAALLKRRPDIAQAEQILAGKNAEIGVARADYFPALQLTGQGGFLSSEIEDLIEGGSQVWSIIPSINFSLFNAGRTAAEVDRATAIWKEALAQYRKTVLIAFKEVEDSLAQIHFLDEQTTAQTKAYKAAAQTDKLTRIRYQAGSVNFLQVAETEKNKLLQEIEKNRLQGERFAARIRLIKAIGGGWKEEQITAKETLVHVSTNCE